MLSITSTRLKKALLHPKEAMLYLINYFKGEAIRFKSKYSLLKTILKKELPKDVYSDLENYYSKRTQPLFFTDNREFLTEIANQNFILETANRILNNEIGFLGINPRILKDIDWHQDIKSNHIWPSDFYLDLREGLIKDYNKEWDIKNVWELSRFHYLIPLALAFYKTGEEKYLKQWQELILDWINKNPVYYGPNWLIAMEVAIRACNWIFSFEIIKTNLQLTIYHLQQEFLEKFLGSLIEHGKFIYENLEYAPVRSNHYLTDIIGLVYLGTMFPEFKEAKKWREKGIRALQEEIQWQVYEDGVDYEMSISYHRYKTELFLWAGWLYQINQNLNLKTQNDNAKFKNSASSYSLSPEFWKKLKKMAEFTLAYTKPNELVPQIGDDDDSRLHLVWENFYNWEKRNHFVLFKLYDHLVKRDCFAEPVLSDSKVLAMTGEKKIRNDIKNNNNNSKSFSEAGFYIMRDKDFYLITGRNKGCYGRGGNHIHSDVLSFELSYFNEDFFIDPGTFTYTYDSKERNRFRSTRAHNTVMIDNKEQDLFFLNPFFIEQKSQLKIIQWQENNEEILFEAQHNGYERLPKPVIHQRKFVFNKRERKLILNDKFLFKGEHNLEWNFHLTPKIKIWLKENVNKEREIILIGENGSLLLIAPKILNCVIIEDEVSPSYGVKVPSKTIRFSGFLDKNSQKEFEFKIEPIK